MTVKTLLSFLFCAFLAAGYAQKVNYTLRMDKPQTHYFQVEMELSDFNESELEVKMPVWSPGSYLVREFAKNVDQVIAVDEKGKSLKVSKTSKNTWHITKGKAKTVHVNYEVYSFELSVRTSFLDLTHGFVSGSGVFMYVDKHQKDKGTLIVHPYKEFKYITTAMPLSTEKLASDGATSFSFENYDQLVDCPLEIGNQEIFDFTAVGIKHTVGIFGQGNYDIASLKIDMKKIVETATDVFKENPNKNYTFIIHNVEDGQGGLEHINSTCLSVNRWTYQGSDYVGFLSLVAHEYFHLWNVKRIRPIELGPFNYDEENYTTLLWVMEGFTSYYDELLLLRAGYYTQDQYLSKLNSSMNYVEGSIGSRIQPVADASFDAWIKAYRPNENSSNTTMTYYSRGQLMAAQFDAMIVAQYEGKKSLDDFMQLLYNKYFKKLDRGFTDKEFQDELSAFVGTDMTDFFDRFIRGTEMPEYDKYFSKVGVNVSEGTVTEASFGARFSDNGGQTIIRSIRRGSAAEDNGFSVNDEILSVNGFRINSNRFTAAIESIENGETVPVLISRDNVLMELQAGLKEYSYPRFKLSVDENSSAKSLRDFWLR
jgi:predicted metalloprotease with PDZ domain